MGGRWLPLIVVISVVVSGCAGPSLTQEIKRRYDMDVLRPPSTLYKPGSVAMVRVVDPGDKKNARIVSLRRYCLPGAALPLNAVNKSETESFSIVYDLSGGFTANAEIKNIVGTSNKLDYVDKIEVSLKNPVIYSPDDGQLRIAVNAIKKVPGCENLRGRSLVTAVLRADVEVKTIFKASAELSVEQKKQIGRFVGAKFGAKLSSGGTANTTGKGLFYAIQIDPNVR